ncbi:GNAT family N-acetyltransferase [Winkia neuii]|uniref:GNAT family N-acetyltransferase n=1 Tax=Winkia neuii TaxID=33007 RepID=A0A2I1IKC0_9ACTO|nr:GNAT family N-acetyltransferase [Winkia neuii]PKY71579.1 GNAT family N-acetyltransferase [Winkia neuii]
MRADRSVRPATVADASEIGRIQLQAMKAELAAGLENPSPALLASLPEEQFVQTWRTSIQSPPDGRHLVLTALDGARVVGFAAIAPAEDLSQATALPSGPAPLQEGPAQGQIVALEVGAKERQRGHGSRLLAACADIFKRTGARRVQVWISAGDSARIKFYSEAGFAPAGLRRKLAVGGQSLIQHVWYTDIDS